MIDFEPTEDQRLMQESVAQLAKSALAPRVRQVERQRAVPDDVRRLAHGIGLGLTAVPEAHGGQGLDMVTSAPFTLATLRFFAKQALVVGARAVGLARFAHALALTHCDTQAIFT